MSTWRVARIHEFCTTGTGGTPSRSKIARYYDGGTIPWVKSGELRERIITDTEEHVTEEALKETGIKMVLAGALLLAMYGATIGRLGTLGVSATTNQAVCHIIPDPRLADVRYLFHALSAQVPSLVRRGMGGAQPNISQTLVNKLAVPLPPLDEQRRIAAILDRADALRAKRRAAIAHLDTLTQSIFLETFSRALPSSRPTPLNEIAQPFRGSFVNGPFGSDLLTSELQPEGVSVIYIRDIREGEYSRVSAVCVTAKKAEQLAFCSVRPGDVLVAKVGDPPGVAAVYPHDAPDAIVTQDVVRIRLAEDRAVPSFVSAYLNSAYGKRDIAGITIQATRSRFALGQFKRMSIPLPPIDVQTDFAMKVDATQTLKTALRASVAELDALFSSLQHRAFRGEL